MIQRILKVVFSILVLAGSLWAFSRVEFVRSGGPIMVPILLTSVLAFALVFSKLAQLAGLGLPASRLLKAIFELLERKRIKEAIDFCDKQDTPLARVLKAGILKYDRPKDEIKESLEDALLFELPPIEEHLSLLSTIIQVAPLLGFVGTMVGLMHLFAVVQAKGASLSSVSMFDISDGIWQALICPAAGFLVAIPTLVATNYLTARIKAFVEEAERAATDLLAFLMERRLSF